MSVTNASNQRMVAELRSVRRTPRLPRRGSRRADPGQSVRGLLRQALRARRVLRLGVGNGGQIQQVHLLVSRHDRSLARSMITASRVPGHRAYHHGPIQKREHWPRQLCFGRTIEPGRSLRPSATSGAKRKESGHDHLVSPHRPQRAKSRWSTTSPRLTNASA